MIKQLSSIAAAANLPEVSSRDSNGDCPCGQPHCTQSPPIRQCARPLPSGRHRHVPPAVWQQSRLVRALTFDRSRGSNRVAALRCAIGVAHPARWRRSRSEQPRVGGVHHRSAPSRSGLDRSRVRIAVAPRSCCWRHAAMAVSIFVGSLTGASALHSPSAPPPCGRSRPACSSPSARPAAFVGLQSTVAVLAGRRVSR